MYQKIFFGFIITTALATSLVSAPAFATDDGIMPINETSETTPIPDTTETTTTTEIAEPGDDTNDERIDLEVGEGDSETPEDAEEEESEPEMWPMYISLGALGVAVLAFIILNAFGKKDK